MKWIGQHIFDFISRFKSEVYYDGVPDGTIEAAKHLGLDSNNRLVKAGTGVAQSPNTVIKMYIKDDDGSTATFDHGRYIKMVPTSAMSIDWDLTNAGSIDHVGNDADPHLLNFSLTPRTFITNLESQTAATYDGTGNASLGITGVLKAAHGGTSQSSFADKSVIISQTSGETILSALPLTTAGGLIVGGSGGPQVATLTEGSNVTITNSDNNITISANASSNNFRTIKVDTNNDGTANETIGATEELKLIGGNDITLSESNGAVTIASTASGGGGGGVYKRNDSVHPTSVADFTQSGVTYDYVLTNQGSYQRLSILNQAQTGIYYELFHLATNLTFNIGSVNFKNSSGTIINASTSYLIGSDSNIWNANCQGLQATLNNVGGGTLSSGTLTTVNRSSSQTFNSSTINVETSDITALANGVFRDGLDADDVDLYYPDDSSWSSGYKTLQFVLQLNDGSGNETNSVTFKFYNKMYHGVDSNATLTGNHASNSGSGSIFNLAQDSFVTTSVSVNQSFSTSGSQYYHLAYPYRYGAKTSFQIDGGPATGLTLVNDNLTVVNANGYSERYYHYRTPNSYTDAGPFTITI